MTRIIEVEGCYNLDGYNTYGEPVAEHDCPYADIDYNGDFCKGYVKHDGRRTRRLPLSVYNNPGTFPVWCPLKEKT